MRFEYNFKSKNNAEQNIKKAKELIEELDIKIESQKSPNC